MVNLGDPRLFNYVIMVLYALNAVRWAYQRNLADVCYWLSALAITATVTFLYDHGTQETLKPAQHETLKDVNGVTIDGP